MAEKCTIKFIFETGKKPVAEIYNAYDDGSSIKGSGNEIIGLCQNMIDELIDNPLSTKNKLPHIKLN